MANLGICAAPGCGKSAAKRGRYCSMHEARLRRGGSLDPRQPAMSLAEHLGGKVRFGSWIVDGEGEPYQRKTEQSRRYGRQRTARCRCDCGTGRDVPIQILKSGRSNHCGCRNGEKNADLHGTHMMSGTPEYRSWAHMKERCLNASCADYPDYGGRGITVCDRWQGSFEAFFADMGRKPTAEFSIDRIDVNGSYEPSNCRWASPMEQAQNQRKTRYVMLEGEALALREACRRIGAPYKVVHARMQKGAGFEEAAAAHLP